MFIILTMRAFVVFAGAVLFATGSFYSQGVLAQAEVLNTGAGPYWRVLGNTNTNPATHYLGTTDNQSLVLRTNAVERMRLLTNGNVGIGTAIPAYRLDLATGTFGFGNSNQRTETRDNAGLQGNAGAQSGFYETSTPTNYPAGAGSWWHLIDTRHSNTGNNYALQIAGSFFDQNLWFRKTNNAANTPWSQLLTTTSGWALLGNAGTNPAVNFIGTTDGVDWVIRTSNTERARVTAGGLVGIGATVPQVRLAVSGNGVNVYATDMWLENNAHVQGNENLNQGGRGRLRIGTAWNYVGLYTEASSSGAGNDLVLGSSSGFSRIGPWAGSGQNLQWSNSLLRDDQGGSIELGGNDPRGAYGNGTPYIDWHVADGYNRNYDIREIATWDGSGPVMHWASWVGNTQYPYFELDWIGAYDNWADVSAWRYWANSTNWLYQDLHNDLDLIDRIRPKLVTDPKSKEPIIINDPLTTPGFITKASKRNNGEYVYDIGAAVSLNTGALRQLRAESKTSDEGQNARIARLEKMVEDLSGKKLEQLVFIAEGTVYKGLSQYVVMDGRLSATSKITVSFKDTACNYHIADQTNGSFKLIFDSPLANDVIFNYSSTVK